MIHNGIGLMRAYAEGFSKDSSESRWTLAEAIDLDVTAPVIALALLERLRSRDPDLSSHKLLAATRSEFGGHAIKPA